MAALVDGVLAAVDAVREMVGCAMAGADGSGAASIALAAIDGARGGSQVAEARPHHPVAEALPHASLDASPSPPPGAAGEAAGESGEGAAGEAAGESGGTRRDRRRSTRAATE